MGLQGGEAGARKIPTRVGRPVDDEGHVMAVRGGPPRVWGGPLVNCVLEDRQVVCHALYLSWR